MSTGPLPPLSRTHSLRPSSSTKPSFILLFSIEMAARAELLLQSADRLGECPIWDGAALWWVDIHAPAIKRYAGGKLEAFPVPEPVGSIAFRAKGGLLAAMQSGIFLYENQKLRRLVSREG